MSIYIIANWATGVVEAIVSFLLFGIFFEKRRNISPFVYWSALPILAILINISNSFLSSTFMNFFLTVIITCGVSFIYRGKIYMRIVAPVLSFMLCTVAELLVLLGMTIILERSVMEIVENGILRIAGIVLSKLLGLGGAIYVYFRSKKKIELLDTNYWILFTLSFVSITIIMGTFYMILGYGVDESIRNMIAICTVGICITMLIILYLYEKTAIHNKLMIEQKQLKNQVRHYTAMMMSQGQIRQLRHDLKNHLLSILAKLNKKEYMECTKYINDMLNNIESKKSSEIETGNTVLDAILSAKKEEAEKKGIKFNTHLLIPRDLPINEQDMCIIFGNALDNAIEACEYVKINPYINVCLSFSEESLFCKIENSCIKPSGEIIATTKKDLKNHGMGRLGIEHALKNYTSVYNIEHTKNKYTLSFVFMELSYE